MDELASWTRLARVPSLSGPDLTLLIEHHGSVGALLAASETDLMATGLAGRTARAIALARAAPVERDLEWLAEPGHHLVPWGSQHYPALLAEVRDAPAVLYLAGQIEVLAHPQLAIVGSRNPTAAGCANAAAFAEHLAHCGLTVTSGLALGIDAAAHRGALHAEAATIAVCACGLDQTYPTSHTRLAVEIAARGALVSEFPPGTPPLRHHFPHRNRIISGLSLGTLVVEAAPSSGSLITARLAAEQGREVFAIPGSIHSPLAKGCHRLIREGARLVESAADILTELQPLAAFTLAARGIQPVDQGPFSPRRLDKDYEILLDALGFDPAGVDLLVARTRLKAGEVASMLLILELEGLVESSPGGLYIRTRSEAVK